MENHRPIRIAGAGPSGLAAAIILARAGRAVEVHEAKGDVGTRFIGDLQIIEGASEAESVPDFLDRLGIERNFYFRAANWATFYDHRQVGRVIRSNEPYGWFIHRGAEEGTLDRGLLAQARNAGATVLFNSRLSPEQADIVATGPASPDGLAKEMTWRVGNVGRTLQSDPRGLNASPPPGRTGESDPRLPPPGRTGESDLRLPPPGRTGESNPHLPPPGRTRESDLRSELIDVYFNHTLSPGGYS